MPQYDHVPTGHDWDSFEHGNPIQRFWHQAKFESIRQEIGAIQQGEVLDIGCGNGVLLSLLPASFEKYGLDDSTKQIEYAKSKRPYHFVVGHAGKIPFPDKKFDLVVSSELVEHMDPSEVRKMFREVHRVLKYNGKFIVTTPNYHGFWPLIEKVWSRMGDVDYTALHINRYDSSSLKQEMNQAGFNSPNTHTILFLSPFLGFLPPLAWLVFHIEKRFLGKMGHLTLGSGYKWKG